VTGSISGTITDPTGSVISGVVVTVTKIAQNVQTKSATDAKGAYTFPSLPVGQYNLKTDAPGFKPSSRANLAVDLDSHVEVDLSLELAERLEQVNGN